MDVTQIQIKTNQTTRSNGGKAKITTQTEVPLNSFNQILSMFNLNGQSPETDGQSDKSLLQGVPDKEGDDQNNPKGPSEEDWIQLGTILTALLAGIQQGQDSSSAIPQPSLLNYSSSNELQQQGVLTITSSVPQNNSDVSKVLDKWLQNVEGKNQTVTLDQRQLMNQIGQLIRDLQPQENQKSFEDSKDLVDKIEMILGELKTENKIYIKTALTSKSYVNDSVVVDGNKQDVKVGSKPRLSMDKNQVMFSTTINPETRNQEGSRVGRGLHTTHEEEIPEIKMPTNLVSHQIEGTDGRIAAKTVPSSITLPVSEFVPEVSEWIDRYMKITNGQSGSTEASFSLYPEHLGHIEIKLTSQQGQVSAQILTDTPLAKDALEGQLQHLRQALQQHGLIVQKLDIVQQTPASIDANQSNLTFSQGGSNLSQQKQTFTSAQDGTTKQKGTDQKEIDSESVSITYGKTDPKAVTRIDFTA